MPAGQYTPYPDRPCGAGYQDVIIPEGVFDSPGGRQCVDATRAKQIEGFLLSQATGQTVYDYRGSIVPTAFAPQADLGAVLRIGECPSGKVSYYGACITPLTDEWNPGDFFSQIGVQVLQAAARVGSAIATGGTSIAVEAASTALQIYQQENKTMGLDLGGIFGGVATALGGLSSGSYLTGLQGVGQIASSFLSSPTPSYAAMPSYSMPQYGIVPYSQPQAPMQAQPVGAFSVAGQAIARLTAPILAKIAVKLGLRARPSLTRAMDMVRKAAKLLTSPEAVAAALGITVAELATLITTSNARKRRRMNPANSKALRRAARRIKSFHRLCTHTDVLKSRGRRFSSKSACGTCKRSPCRC